MILRAIYIAAHLALVGGAPADLSFATVAASTAYGVDPSVLGGNLVSGHPGGRYSGKCGDGGKTCGPFRLHELWPVTFGYEQADRDHVWHSAAMASQLMLYAERRHLRCRGGHDYRAHLKSSSGRRDTPRADWKVRVQLRSEKAMCPEPLCTLLKFAP